MRPSSFAALAWMLGAACADPGHPVRPELQVVSPADVVLHVGESVRIDDALVVRFERVTNESRCPTGVWCFWEGDAAVLISHSLAEWPVTLDTLHTNTRFATATQDHWYHIALLDLEPYPADPSVEGDDPPQEGYKLHLRVENTWRAGRAPSALRR